MKNQGMKVNVLTRIIDLKFLNDSDHNYVLTKMQKIRYVGWTFLDFPTKCSKFT